MSHNSHVLHCAWLIRCGEKPLANQRLTVVDEVLQEITDVPADEQSLIQPVAVLPAFVNAHTHLEFSKLQSPLPPPSPFPDWIRSVVKYRRSELSDENSIRNAITAGYEESLTAGASVVGEICTSDDGRDALIASAANSSNKGLSAVCFRELLGFTANRVTEQQQLAENFVNGFDLDAPTTVIAGLSPHAPYSVHPETVEHASRLSGKLNLPIAMHLAETTDEVQFVESGTGRFVDFLDGLGLWQPETLSGIRSISDYLAMLKSGAHALAVHGNYFNSRDLQMLGKAANITTVYCVRTHRWFGHSNHPWRQIEAAGGRVILGTDSRASNPDLSIWKELQTFCHLHSQESLINRLPMISTDAATALGLNASSVNLTLGAPFHATVVSTTAETEAKLEASLMSDAAKPMALQSINTAKR